MKNGRLCLLNLLPFLFIISCSSDIGIAENVDILEDYPKTASTLSIQKISLEGLNTILSANELEIFTQDRLENYRYLRDEKSCLNAKFKGDLDNDKNISSDDLLLIYKIISQYDNVDMYPETANGDGRLDVNKEYKGQSPSFWSVVHLGQLVTYDESGDRTTYLDHYDAAVLADLLIGYCE